MKSSQRKRAEKMQEKLLLNLLGLRKSQPKNKNELEDVVEGCRIIHVSHATHNRTVGELQLTEPVGGTDRALDDSKERINHPVLSCVG